MFKLFGGMIIFIFGLFVGVVAYYFAWATGTPGLPINYSNQYQVYSGVLALISLGIIVFGVFLVVKTIKRMNDGYRKSNSNR